MTKGFFITFEGGEGAGKTTQIKALHQALAARGHDVLLTREPGGTPEGEKIRDLLVSRDGGAWTAEAECLLLFAARQMHIEKLIRPALARGKIVLCDRFTDSTRAYQSYGRGLDLAYIERLDALSTGAFRPDLTFILDIPAEEGLARAGRRLEQSGAEDSGSAEDRFERIGIGFHRRLRQGFLDIAAREPGRCVVIDAMEAERSVAKKACEAALAALAACGDDKGRKPA